MRRIPKATVVFLMSEERAELEGLARSTEHRLRQLVAVREVTRDWLPTWKIKRQPRLQIEERSEWIEPPFDTNMARFRAIFASLSRKELTRLAELVHASAKASPTTKQTPSARARVLQQLNV